MRNIAGISWIPIYLLMYIICFIMFIVVSAFTQFLGSKKSQSIGKWLLTLPERITLKTFNV